MKLEFLEDNTMAVYIAFILFVIVILYTFRDTIMLLLMCVSVLIAFFSVLLLLGA